MVHQVIDGSGFHRLGGRVLLSGGNPNRSTVVDVCVDVVR